VAVISGGNQVDVLNRFTRQPVASVKAPGAQAIAISREWLTYMAIRRGRYLLRARRINNPANPGDLKGIASVPSPNQLGHPSINGSSVFYTVSKRHRNSIKRHNLRSGKDGTVLRSRTVQLLNPTVQGKHLLYVRVSRGSESPQATHPRRLNQTLMIKRRSHRGPGHKIYRRGRRGTLWTTALAGRHALATVLGHGGPKIISTHR
jgi:hypothetical protein